MKTPRPRPTTLAAAKAQFAGLDAEATNVSADDAPAVEQLAPASRSMRGAKNERHLKVSLTRRCPVCRSRDVVKEANRSYSCHQCGRVFTGFRIAFLRFSK